MYSLSQIHAILFISSQIRAQTNRPIFPMEITDVQIWKKTSFNHKDILLARTMHNKNIFPNNQ